MYEDELFTVVYGVMKKGVTTNEFLLLKSDFPDKISNEGVEKIKIELLTLEKNLLNKCFNKFEKEINNGYEDNDYEKFLIAYEHLVLEIHECLFYKENQKMLKEIRNELKNYSIEIVTEYSKQLTNWVKNIAYYQDNIMIFDMEYELSKNKLIKSVEE